MVEPAPRLSQCYPFGLNRLVKELDEAEKKSKDPGTTSDKKTFLKVQIPKLTTEIATTKSKVANLMEADELDPRGEWYVLAKKLLKKK